LRGGLQMAVVRIEPTDLHPIPFDTGDERPATLIEEMAVAANTVEVQVALGAPLEVDDRTAEREKELIEQVVQDRKTKALANTTTAFAAAAFLRTYGQQLALDVAQVRAAITHKLMEIANCGDARYELKALELLGKHSDIGLFTERSEITINYKDPKELEHAIKERVKRLLNADVVDIAPISVNLDDQLGVAEIPEYRTELMQELDEPRETDEVPSDDSPTNA
jgi:hypothetical protein